MSDLRAELTESLDQAEWDWLVPHDKRGNVIVVTEGLDLVDVGYAIANDHTPAVEQWIRQLLIYKPSDEQRSLWVQTQKRFTALIVQPYVLVQELANAADSTEGTES